MYKLRLSGRFKKSYKRCMKRGYDKSLFEEVVAVLMKGDKLPENIRIILYMVIMKAGMIVIFFQIGFWFGVMIMMNWSCVYWILVLTLTFLNSQFCWDLQET